MELHLSDVGKIWIRVRNRPTKRLEPASRPRSSRNHKGVCRDPHPPPEKSGVLAAIYQVFTFASPNRAKFKKRVQKPKFTVFEPTWQKHGFC